MIESKQNDLQSQTTFKVKVVIKKFLVIHIVSIFRISAFLYESGG